MKKTTNGFTLVELLIVIVVIAILAAISIVAYNGIQERAHASQAASTAEGFVKLLKMYKVDHGHYPVGGSSVAPYYNTACFGKASDFPSTADFAAGECMTVNNGNWKAAVSTVLMNSLSTYGTASGSAEIVAVFVEDGAQHWRGVIYDPDSETAPMSAFVQWHLKGNRVKQCGLAATTGSWYDSNYDITRCSIYLQ